MPDQPITARAVDALLRHHACQRRQRLCAARDVCGATRMSLRVFPCTDGQPAGAARMYADARVRVWDAQSQFRVKER